MTESFPRQSARTRRFTLGVPRSFTVTPDGRVLFLRSRSGSDPVTCLWEFADGTERLLFDPGADPSDLAPEERARRERLRETAGGVVAYATDDAGTTVAFALGGDLYVRTDEARHVATAGPVLDPRPSPDGSRVAYVTGGALHVVDLATGKDRTLAAPEHDRATYGLADFIAAEELDRHRGYWWSPTGEAVLAARVDETPVREWFIGDPANPDREPARHRYPAAGTDNAVVSLAVLRLDGSRVDLELDHEYLVNVRWDEHALIVVTMDRAQRTTRLARVDPATGAREVLREDADDQWVEVMNGVPAHLKDGRLVWLADADGRRRLLVGEEDVTPPDLVIRDVLSVGEGSVLFRASLDQPYVGVFRWDGDLTDLRQGGVWSGTAKGDVTVLVGSDLADETVQAIVRKGDQEIGRIASHAERSGLKPRVAFHRAGPRELSTAVLLPTGYESGPLPVLMDPYGGPHAQRVLGTRRAFLEPQWWADQGFAVVVCDPRGTPGRGAAFEREIHRDFTLTLDDQVDALTAVAGDYDLDLTKVAIRGWSFGGYLAALAVLRRPDVFHAAVAGAPVTDWLLYDTAYTERYLGHPRDGDYDANSLLDDAAKLERPLMIVHGLADDNVVAAHTLRLSSALLAAGRPHSVLPLSGVTHMTPQEVVAENLMLLQLDFLRRSLGLDAQP